MARAAALAVAILPAALGTPEASENLIAATHDFSQSLGFSAAGCYEDKGSNRIFSGSVERMSNLKKSTCRSKCKEYPYYGLQNGNECWCGDYTSDLTKHGTADNCNIACTGNSNVNCGGRLAMRAFSQAESDKDAIGCFKDARDRIFENKLTDKSGMTPEKCERHCKDDGYFYYGTQWGEECWCGSSNANYEQNGSATCDRPCSGDPTKLCGGSFAMTVYTVDGAVVPDYRCYADKGNDRVGFNMVKSSSNSYEFCSDYCDGFNAAWAFVQFGEECFCGYTNTDIDKHGSATCNYECTGDSSQTCGGRGAFNAIPLEGNAPEPSSPSPISPSPSTPMPVPSPTPVMTIPSRCTGTKSAIRWAQGTGLKGRMYLEDGGCGTMTDLYKSRVEKDGWTPKGPIYILDNNNNIMMNPTAVTGKWLLTSELHVLRGSIFYCRGTNLTGGDCDELRIQSTGPQDFHEVRGHGGSLYFRNTIVTSWDTPNKRPQEEYEGGRSFLNCVSEFESDETCEGQPKNDFGECRMDIINSEMGYMGWFDSESYGLTWKVRGFCVNKGNPEVFDTTNVYGDIIDSDIHHMYYGMYSYGHQGGIWTGNKMHDNHQYGFDPHDDSDYLTIKNNEVWNNVNHGIIASKRCNNVEIANNEVYDGGAQAAGIFLHRSSDSCKVYDNYVHDMQDAGLAILESFDADIYDNRFENVKYGIRISLGGANNEVHNNVFDNCDKYGLYTYKGSDAPEKSDDGRPGENKFYDNTISNTYQGVKIKEGDNTVITDNTFTGCSLLEFNNAKGTAWSSNTFRNSGSDLCYKNQFSSTFASTGTLPPLC